MLIIVYFKYEQASTLAFVPIHLHFFGIAPKGESQIVLNKLVTTPI
jgi:hypothetical protein